MHDGQDQESVLVSNDRAAVLGLGHRHDHVSESGDVMFSGKNQPSPNALEGLSIAVWNSGAHGSGGRAAGRAWAGRQGCCSPSASIFKGCAGHASADLFYLDAEAACC